MVVTAYEMAEKLTALRGNNRPQDYSERLLIRENRLIIASDVHVPYHDEQLVAKFIEHAYRESFEAVVWLGDLMDNPTFSTWDREDLVTTFENELEQIEGIIRLTSEVVKKQYWSIGNHEVRWMRRMGYQARMKHLALLAHLQDLLDSGRLVVSDNPAMDADHGNWMLVHPAEYGQTPLVVPGKLADQFHQNVISAHAHHWGQGTSPSGQYTVADSGGMFEPRYVAYINNRVTTHRKWTKGYCSLEWGQLSMHR